MKLYSILFESVGESDILNVIKKTINSNTETGIRLKHSFLYPMRDENRQTPIKEILDKLAEDIYEKNKDQFDQIFKGVDKIEYLGSGAIGVAFDLGDYILKIEYESGSHYDAGKRAEKAASVLYPETKKSVTSSPETTDSINNAPTRKLKEDIDRSLAKYVPMIYDKGVIKYSNDSGSEIKLNWILMEKFETLSEDSKYKVETLLLAITMKFSQLKSLTPEEKLKQNKDINTYTDSIKKVHDELTSELRLKDGWFADLVQGMRELGRKGITDFHPGNIGIRRSGSEGSFVFFD